MGDCGSVTECASGSGEPPAILAEFLLDFPIDFYNISLVGGFNIPVSIVHSGGARDCANGPFLRCKTDGGQAASGVKLNAPLTNLAKATVSRATEVVTRRNVPVPVVNSPVTPSRPVDCNSATCLSDLNHHCPHELQVRRNGHVVACKSACLAFNQPEYCCTGAYNNPKTFSPSNYSRMFKDSCPAAYSYAYEDSFKHFYLELIT
ncbi:thaumatin-like protein 3 [Actinidia rufa]|uniref:Thaumatin-like protein 3 n=1 Tax=Actinidia rufa TaxID=165716 RepID=A0A7J0F0E4_9ERIC|nr:thaumatin-like protein 3 [Actinidia rufa]